MVALPKPVEPEIQTKPLHPIVAQDYEFTNFVYFDIETIPDQTEGALEKYRQKVQPPKNIKKQESIDTWMAENAEKAAIKLLEDTSFDGGAGHVCTVGWATNDGPIHVEHAEDVGEERDILKAFFDGLPKRDATLVGHNILGFDIPFLLKRAVSLGVELPSPYVMARDPKPWTKGVFDTMTAWDARRENWVSMNRLCGILGIVGKSGFEGSMVAEAWAAGDHMKIVEYCHDDVQRTRAIHQKFLAARF